MIPLNTDVLKLRLLKAVKEVRHIPKSAIIKAMSISYKTI